MLDGFLVGGIATACITAALFFLRFWRATLDPFFLAFALSFTIEGAARATDLFLPAPHEGSPWIYLLRLLSYIIILFAIVRKNYGERQ